MNPITITELDGAILRKYWNEMALDQKAEAPPDPVKLRFGGWREGYFGAISGDLLTGDPSDPRRLEKVLIALRTDDNYPPGAYAGCVEIFTQDPHSEGDAGMKMRARLSARGLELTVPVIGASLPSASVSGVPFTTSAPLGSVSRCVSPNGRYLMQVQDDGHTVQYDTHNSPDESTWTPVWSNWWGLLRPLPWT